MGERSHLSTEKSENAGVVGGGIGARLRAPTKWNGAEGV